MGCGDRAGPHNKECWSALVKGKHSRERVGQGEWTSSDGELALEQRSWLSELSRSAARDQ